MVPINNLAGDDIAHLPVRSDGPRLDAVVVLDEARDGANLLDVVHGGLRVAGGIRGARGDHNRPTFPLVGHAEAGTGLPGVALEDGAIRRIEGDRHRHAGFTFSELHRGHAVAERVLNQAVGHDVGVGAFEVESDAAVRSLWADITPLARNEWICWVTSAKQEATGRRRIEVGLDKMRGGMRRPCCWPGCPHR